MKKFPSIFVLIALSPAASADFTDLFISEYIEGSSNNKAIELFNPTENLINLEEYQLGKFTNGNTSPAFATLPDGVTIAPNSTYVIANPKLSDISNVNYTTSYISHNGNDTYALYKNNILIDSIGKVSSENYAADITLARFAESAPDIDLFDDFDATQWQSFEKDTLSGLGKYGFIAPTTVSISQIQGSSELSPYAGQRVTTEGIITYITINGYTIQSIVPDDNEATSEALFVYTNQVPSNTLNIGDIVRVNGTISEYIPGGANTGNLSNTQLNQSTVDIIGSTDLPSPVLLNAAPTEDSIMAMSYFEQFEYMRVTIPAGKSLSSINKFNEIFLLATDAPSNYHGDGVLTISETDLNPERIRIVLEKPIAPNVFDIPSTVQQGDSVSQITGVLGYEYGMYQVMPTQTFSSTSNNRTTTHRKISEEQDILSFATYNVLNLDPVVEDLSLVPNNNPNHIDDDVGEGRFENIATHIVDYLANPDIIALQEIQDSDGAEDTGNTDAIQTAQTLIQAINSAGGPNYTYADIAPQDRTSGGQPGGNIRNGYLYNANRVKLIANSIQHISTPAESFIDSRKALYGEFIFNEHIIGVTNVHFASKGGSTPLLGNVQPPVNGKETQRVAQAQAVAEFISTQTTDKQIILGDFNSFSFESPITLLTSAGYTNLENTLSDAENITYNFRGNSQMLDHVIVNSTLSHMLHQIIIPQLNTPFDNAASDHNPIFASFHLPKDIQPSPLTISLKQPSEGTTIMGQFTILGSTSEGANIKAYVIQKNQTFTLCETTTENLSFSCQSDSKLLENGDAKIRVTATVGDNTIESKEITVTIANPADNVSIQNIIDFAEMGFDKGTIKGRKSKWYWGAFVREWRFWRNIRNTERLLNKKQPQKTRRACRKIRKLIRHTDGVNKRKQKEWLIGSDAIRLNHMLIDLYATQCK